MDRNEFEQALLAAKNHPACVRAIAGLFDSGGLHFGHGTATAMDEAHWLVASCLDWDEDLWRQAPDPATLARIVDIAWRRVDERVPLAYLLGEAWFAGLRFYVDRSVLVPRSPLAELIENEFAPWCALRAGDRVLEVGTGSGCIAIATAYYMKGVSVVATDVSAPALALANRNAEALGVANRVTFVAADLFPGDDGPYRVIISNPPYVPLGRLAELPAEYGHEPELGLAGGPDGLGPVRRLLTGARTRLAPDGILVVEVGESDRALEAEYPQLPLTWLEFEHGGTGVFLLTYDDLVAAGW
jgi:ribosomal protein L3 glutamine methyltransferase